METIRLKIRVKKQAEKELIKMVNNGEVNYILGEVLDQVKKIQNLRDGIAALKKGKSVTTGDPA